MLQETQRCKLQGDHSFQILRNAQYKIIIIIRFECSVDDCVSNLINDYTDCLLCLFTIQHALHKHFTSVRHLLYTMRLKEHSDLCFFTFLDFFFQIYIFFSVELISRYLQSIVLMYIHILYDRLYYCEEIFVRLERQASTILIMAKQGSRNKCNRSLTISKKVSKVLYTIPGSISNS